MPDVENAAQLHLAIAYGPFVTDVIFTGVGPITNQHGQRPQNYELLTAHRELVALRHRERYPDTRTRPPLDFELRELPQTYSNLKSAITRAAERERFR